MMSLDDDESLKETAALWLGLHAAATESPVDPLSHLSASRRAAASSVGAAPDGKGLTAHLTVARLRRRDAGAVAVTLVRCFHPAHGGLPGARLGRSRRTGCYLAHRGELEGAPVQPGARRRDRWRLTRRRGAEAPGRRVDAGALVRDQRAASIRRTGVYRAHG